MPPLSLVDTLDEMYQVSAQHQAPVHKELMRGLHVKVFLRPSGRRELIAWRNGDTPPSGTEMEILADDAGFIQGVYRSYELPSNPDASAYRIVESFSGKVCEHQWGMQVHVDDRRHYGEANVCRKCQASWKCLFPRKGSGKASWYYNGKKRRESAVRLLMKRGPVPDKPLLETDADLAELQQLGEAMKRRPVERALAAADEVTTVPPMTAREREESRRQALKATKEQREDALKKRLIGGLLCISLWHALVNPWFANGIVIAARRKFLQDSKLPDLLEEAGGRWFRSNIRYALPYVLLVCRWTHATRALPLTATPAAPAKRTRKPRSKKAEVTAA